MEFAPHDHVVAATEFDVGYMGALFASAAREEFVALGHGLTRAAIGAGVFLVDGCTPVYELGGGLGALVEGVVRHLVLAPLAGVFGSRSK